MNRHPNPRLSLLAALALPALGLAWGQPEHAVQGAETLKRFGHELPPSLSVPGAREDFIYACYSPDGYLFHGPEYVHLDRHFALMLQSRATDARGEALAYGWASHQEQDTAGHGRYINDSGLAHLKKELSVGTRLRYQGSRWEKDIIKGMRAVFDVDAIHDSSKEYVNHFGSQYEVITKRHAKITGYGYAAYLTALKSIQWSMYYGYLKWKPSKYPRSEWQIPFVESVILTRDWCKDPFSFSGTLSQVLRKGAFGAMVARALNPEPLAVESELIEQDPADAAHRVRGAVAELLAKDGGAVSGARSMTGELHVDHFPDSHVLVRDDQFVQLGAALATSSGIRMEERTDGHFYEVEPVVVDPTALARDTLAILRERSGGLGAASTGIFASGQPRGERAEFFDMIEEYTQRALEEHDAGKAPFEP